MLRKKKIPGLLMALGLCLALLPAAVAAAEDAPAAEAVSSEESYETTAAEALPAANAEYTSSASARAMLAGSDSEKGSPSDAEGEDVSPTDALDSDGILGDVNGDKTIDTADLIRLMKYLCGDTTVGDLSVAGDINGDSGVDARDLCHLLKFVNGQITSLR